MTTTEEISTAAYRLGQEFGKRLVETKDRLASGLPFDSAEGHERRAGIRAVKSMYDGLLFTARLFLEEDDWSQFLYRTGIPPAEAEAAIQNVRKITNP